VGHIVLLVDKRVRAFGTVIAPMAVRSGTLVLPQMGLHVVHLGEALVAHRTGEWLVARVGSHVPLQVGLGARLETAHLALQPLGLVVVDHLVLVQGHLVDESLGADLALVRRFAGVPGHVVLQPKLAAEPLGANGAGKLLDGFVVLEVAYEAGVRLQRLATLITDIAGKVLPLCVGIVGAPAGELLRAAGTLYVDRVLAGAVVILVLVVALAVGYYVFYGAVQMVVKVAHGVFFEEVGFLGLVLGMWHQIFLLLPHLVGLLLVYDDLVVDVQVHGLELFFLLFRLLYNEDVFLLLGHLLLDTSGIHQSDALRGGVHLHQLLMFLLFLILLSDLLNVPIELGYGPGFPGDILLLERRLLEVLGHVGTVDQLEDLLAQLARDLNRLVVPGQLLAAFLAYRRRFVRQDVVCAPGALQDQLADQHRRVANGLRVNVLGHAHGKLANAAIHFPNSRLEFIYKICLERGLHSCRYRLAAIVYRTSGSSLFSRYTLLYKYHRYTWVFFSIYRISRVRSHQNVARDSRDNLLKEHIHHCGQFLI